MESVYQWVNMVLTHFVSWVVLLLTVMLVFKEQIRDFIKNMEIEYKGFKARAKSVPALDSKPNSSNQVAGYEPSKNDIDLLNTMFYYQKQHHGQNRSQRWGFQIQSPVPTALSIIKSIHDLFHSGFVMYDYANNIYVLSDIGYEYCLSNNLGSSDVLGLFSR